MSSLFKVNQPIGQQEAQSYKTGQATALESRDREIYALRQQLQTLKSLYKNTKAHIEASHQKNLCAVTSEKEYSKQRVEKLMAALAEREKQMRLMQQDSKQQLTQATNEWQKEKESKQNALCEIAALHGQVEFLKNKLLGSQSDVSRLKGQLRATENKAQDLQSSANAWEKKYEELAAACPENDHHFQKFKHLEEKLSHMKTLWSSLDELFGEKSLKETQISAVQEQNASVEFMEIDDEAETSDHCKICPTSNPLSV